MASFSNIESFLLNCSSEQRQDLAQSILNWQPGSTHAMPTKQTTAKKAKNSKPKIEPTGVVLAAKRPLNSWMAFRSFYAHIFARWQQKEISGFLTRMWQEDPFKAKWTIVAKAYSIIRDQVGKTKAPLDKFLQIACPLIGIISPVDYLDKLGWMKPNGQETQMVRRFVPDVNQFRAHLRTTNLSADDIVRHCRDIGYIANELKTDAGIASKASLTMAAEPNASSSARMLVAPTGLSAINISGTNNIITASTGAEWDVAFAKEFIVAPGNTQPQNMSSVQLDEDVAAFTELEMNNLLLAASGDSYPYNDQFEPDDLASGLGLFFDPMGGGDEGLAFDLHPWNV